MKLRKRIAALGAAMVMAVSMMSIGAGAYNLHYSQGAPSSQNKITETTPLTASGVDRITVYSTTFNVYISGAYCYADCTNHSVASANINATSTYYLVYSGDSIPKSGVSVSVSTTLKNHVLSRYVMSSGSMTA